MAETRPHSYSYKSKPQLMSVPVHNAHRPISGTTRRSSANSSTRHLKPPSGRPVRRRSAGSCPPDVLIKYLGHFCWKHRRAASWHTVRRRPRIRDRTGCRRTWRASAIDRTPVRMRHTRAKATASSRPASDARPVPSATGAGTCVEINQ